MKWFHFIRMDENDPDEKDFILTTTIHTLLGINVSSLKDGIHIDNWNSEATTSSPDRSGDGKAWDVLHNTLGVPIFSQHLREVLEAEVLRMGEVQFLPIRVFRSTGEELVGYSVANILRPVVALDRERSRHLMIKRNRIDPATGKPWVGAIGVAALVENKLTERSIIRLIDNNEPVYVSEAFVDVFRKHKFVGGYFPPAIMV